MMKGIAIGCAALALGAVGTALAVTPLVDAESRWDAQKGYWKPNHDEAKVAPYALEDPLVFESGRRVESVLDWPARRAEILDIFAKRMFGAEPPKPEKVSWDLVNEKVGAIAGYATRRVYRMYFTADKSGPSVDWGLWLPRHAKGPVPVVVFLNYRGIQEIDADTAIPLCRGWSRRRPALGVSEHRATEATRGALQKADSASNLPIQSILARGYAILSASYTDVSPDPDAFGADGVDQYAFATTNGVFALWGPRDESRTDNITSIGAWAWALSRGLDLALAQPEIDRWRTVVTGCSRLGKAAFLAGARDPRFAVCVPNQCGGGGVCLGKRDFGENVSTENAMFTHWYCKKYRDYAANPAELMDFDMHLLLAAIAPRRVLVEGFGPNDWMDTRGEYLAVRAASPVWDFWGLGGLPDTGYPDYYDTAAIGGYVGYVRRTEAHGISGYDWKWMLDFADAAWRNRHPQANCFQKPFWYGIVARRQQEVRAAQGKTVDLVLVGDSITSNWDSPKRGSKAYAVLTNAYRVVNLGVPSDRTDDVAWRCRNGQLDGYRARYVMVFSGTNDIWQEPADKTAVRIERLLDLVARKQPGAKIIVMAPLPLKNDPSQPVRKACAELKALLRPQAEKRGCIWMDFESELFEKDGSIRNELRPDGVHIMDEGYQCWRRALERILKGT